MRIVYVCRYCRQWLGQLDRPGWSSDDVDRHCGFQLLSAVERLQAIAYNEDRKVVYVNTVCDHCQSAVEAHPELLVEGDLLQ